MTAGLPPFPDAEDVVMALLEPFAPTVTETPAELDPPLICVYRVGGNSDWLQDSPRMSVACYGADRKAAWRLAREVEAAVINARGTEVDGTLIDNASTDNPPTQPPYLNPDTRRVLAYYRFVWRRPTQ